MGRFLHFSKISQCALTEAVAVEFTQPSHSDDPQGDNVRRGFCYPIRSEWRAGGATVWASNVLVVRPSVPINTITAFIEYVRKRPGGINWANAGIGSSPATRYG